MMKKLLVLVAVVLSMNGLWAQQTVGTPEEIERFLKSTTYVVLENNPMLEYNQQIKKTVEKHWKLTPVKFVTFSTDEYEKARMDPNNSFLIRHTWYFDRDKVKAKYDFLCVELGGDYQYARQMPNIAQVPISYTGVEEDYFGYKLGMLCLFLQNHINLTRENPALNNKNIVKYYNGLRADIHDKTLYVVKEDLSKDVNSLKKIKEIYPYKVEIVTKDKVKEAIDKRDDQVVFLHKIGPESAKRKARCYNIIVGASDARMYNFSWHMISEKKTGRLIGERL